MAKKTMKILKSDDNDFNNIQNNPFNIRSFLIRQLSIVISYNFPSNLSLVIYLQKGKNNSYP